MKILVCGGRDYTDRLCVYEELDKRSPTLIITGGARGADALAFAWAQDRGVPCAVFSAAWDAYGRGAGPIRNKWMLDHGHPDIVLAFPGGSGTADMVKQANHMHIAVEKIDA